LPKTDRGAELARPDACDPPPLQSRHEGRGGGEVFGPQPDPWRFGPVPDPWRLGTVEIGLYGAITLYQMGRLVSGPVAEGYTSAAGILFDDTCGTVPLSELIALLLHRPPPPPPQWLNVLTFAGETLAFAQATQQEGLATAASRRITESLKAFGFQIEQARLNA
jgi:hypothetical protein